MKKEDKKHYDNLTIGASNSELITWAWWGFFSKKKFKRMNELLELGMAFTIAMKQDKNEL